MFHFRFDGLEFKILSEVTSKWNKTYLRRDRKDKLLQFEQNERARIREDLDNGDADMGICSIWLSFENYQKYKLSRPYSSQCITLMVPAPRQIVNGNFIFYPFSDTVWFSYIGSFILSVAVVHILSIITHESELRKNFVIHLISTAFCVPITHVPIKFRVRVIISSWLIFSLFFNLSYSTGFTSILTSPRFTPNINNIDTFLTTGKSINLQSLSIRTIYIKTSIKSFRFEVDIRRLWFQWCYKCNR